MMENKMWKRRKIRCENVAVVPFLENYGTDAKWKQRVDEVIFLDSIYAMHIKE